MSKTDKTQSDLAKSGLTRRHALVGAAATVAAG